jgi:hypothetical protein
MALLVIQLAGLSQLQEEAVAVAVVVIAAAVAAELQVLF